MSTELPKLTYPRIMMMATDNFMGDQREMLTWAVGRDHPFAPAMKVIAMFDTGKFIEVYSVSGDTKSGDRGLVPERFVRFLGEAMPFDVFQEELARAELGEDDDEDDADPEDESSALSGQVSANGQTAP